MRIHWWNHLRLMVSFFRTLITCIFIIIIILWKLDMRSTLLANFYIIPKIFSTFFLCVCLLLLPMFGMVFMNHCQDKCHEIFCYFLFKNFTIFILCSFSKPGFSNMWTVKFLMFKLVLEKAEEPEIKLSTSAGSWKKQESSRKTFISA